MENTKHLLLFLKPTHILPMRDFLLAKILKKKKSTNINIVLNIMFPSNYSPNTQQVLQGTKRSLDHNDKTPFATLTGRENLLLENE